MRSFCRGVPVMSSRLRLLKFSSVCHRWDFQFLIMWASSKIRNFHFLRRNILASCRPRTGVYQLALFITIFLAVLWILQEIVVTDMPSSQGRAGPTT